MAGRPRILEEHQILEKAIDLFWENGYEATSLDDLLSCMKLNKGSLYHVFGSKRELFAKALDRFGSASQHAIEQKIKSAKNPVEGIRNFFMDLASSGSKAHLKGCFMGNTISELSGIDKQLKDKAVRNLKALEDLFCTLISEAKKSGELTTREDARVIARHLVTLWNGINITRRMYPASDDLEPLIRMQLSVLH